MDNVLGLHRCKICGARWLLWPQTIHSGGWNLLDQYQKPGQCCDNVAMENQIEHLRDIPLTGASAAIAYAAKFDQIRVLANAMKKVLPPALLSEVLAHCDPLTPFLESLRKESV